MQHLDLHVSCITILSVLTWRVEVDFVSLIVGLVQIDQNAKVVLAIFESYLENVFVVD